MRLPAATLLLTTLLAAPATPLVATADEPCEADVEFALDELQKRCGHFFRQKDIDWKKVRKEFTKQAKDVDDPGEHWRLLVRLVARLRDGHARVQKTEAAKDVEWPEKVDGWAGPGFHLTQIGKKYYVKLAFSSAAEVGLEPGSEVLKVDGVAAKKWVEEKVASNRDTISYSTEQHALFHTLSKGLGAPKGTRIKLEVKDPDGKKKKKTITYDRATLFVEGPLAMPVDTKWVGDSVRWGRTESGWGYVNIRRIRGELLAEVDTALEALADAPGLILDFRGNTGGGCDHDALEGRFVPKGHELPRMARSRLPSAGEHPYGGPIVVIVDGSIVSAGETTSGMFKEDGRAYMIGESPTAGMSSSKDTIVLPSGLFELYVSVRSNRSSFNGGRGIEGIGVAPVEIVEFTPEDLAVGVDTLLRRAEELLADFPQKKVQYDPADYGWER